MNVFTSIEKEDIKKRIADKKRLAKRDGHEDGYWFSLLDSCDRGYRRNWIA